MAYTGWQIQKCLLAVGATGTPVDRNGRPMTGFDINGIPVSAAGWRQAARIWNRLDATVDRPNDESTRAYSDLYDVIGSYSVNTEGRPITVDITDSATGLVVATYQGETGGACPIPIPVDPETEIIFTVNLDGYGSHGGQPNPDILRVTTLPGSSEPIIVDWGHGGGEEELDFTQAVYDGTYYTFKHLFPATSGQYQVKIKEFRPRLGQIITGGLTVRGSSFSITSIEKCSRRTSTIGVRFMSNAFISFSNDFKVEMPRVTSLVGMFSDCWIATLPSAMFSLCTNVTSCLETFKDVSFQSANSVPDDLFDGCVNLTDAVRTFSGSNLYRIPNNLFSTNKELVNVSECFKDCLPLAFTFVPSSLFLTNTKIRDFSGLFEGCTSILSINDFRVSSAAINCSGMFKGCRNLISVPYNPSLGTMYNSSIFTRGVNILDFYETFSGCSKLTTIPGSIFTTCEKVRDFENCFKDCSSLTSGPASYHSSIVSSVLSFARMFSGCRALTDNVITALNANKPTMLLYNARSVEEMFLDCSNVIGNGTNFANLFAGYKMPSYLSIVAALCFRNASKITNIPSGWG